MRQVFSEWGVVAETKSTSYGIEPAPVATIRRYMTIQQAVFCEVLNS